MTDETVGSRIRIGSVDLLRGIVIIIMALDHVRDYYSQTAIGVTDLSQIEPAWFLTRWITHFCAPVFVFLSGTSAWLYAGNRNASTGELSRFLLSRGMWLIFVEVVFITAFWQFGYQIVIAQVIWALGWSMVALAVLVYLPKGIILAIGLVMIFGHNLLDGIQPADFGSYGWLWQFLHVSGFIPLPQVDSLQGIYVGYPLVPWIGVMAVGYVFGAWLDLPPAERDRRLYIAGLTAIGLFLVLRGFNLFGENGVTQADSTWTDHGRGSWIAALSFLNTTKYPPSLLYLLMTLGPAIAIMPLLERWRGKVADIVTVYGRVPFLFYFVHIPLIHATSILYFELTIDAWRIDLFNPASWPEGYGPDLLRCYLAWALIVAAMYWPCRLFMNYRKTHKQWWLSYL
jgi:uncharacterized membrane protein